MAANPVEAEGLVRRFGNIVAVDGIDLVVQQGEVFGFLGPNGAGKSTTCGCSPPCCAPAGARPGSPATT
jgi:ABC-type multidrug transport system ATPase subunit